mmetsp:Transcript_11406/g.26807  ORF Transcript_11406/g.26807 Transcript_11406/m.26807 type:complete len:181 (+) Transcript_11406:1931-2473(+)
MLTMLRHILKRNFHQFMDSKLVSMNVIQMITMAKDRIIRFASNKINSIFCPIIFQFPTKRLWKQYFVQYKVVIVIIAINRHPNVVPNSFLARVRLNLVLLLDFHHCVRLDKFVENSPVILGKGCVQLSRAFLHDFRCKRFNAKIVHLLSRNLQTQQSVTNSAKDRFHPVPCPSSRLKPGV